MIEAFGVLDGTREVQAITLGARGGLQAQVLTFGGILRRLVFPSRGVLRELTITLPDLDAYLRDRTFQGVLVGRVANRIGGARFDLKGREYRLTANDGPNHLHGGDLGFGKRLWRVLGLQNAPRHRLLLGLSSPDGEEGYPGNLEMTVEFTVEGSELRLEFEAQSDEATPLNLTYHPYFNFADDMNLRIPASRFLPVKDSRMIPTGQLARVDGTPFDFRSARSVVAPAPGTHPQLAHAAGYDHCWVLDSPRDCDAELQSLSSGVRMTIHSERPGIQFYGGQHLRTGHPGLHGICLEPEGFPNAVNEPSFPPCVLEAGSIFRSTLIYRFGEQA
ncbi:MAG: aldose epimerase family protein [Gammaproteobacteria bacterium]